MPKIIRWQTPFTDVKFPSVALGVTNSFGKWNDVTAVVMPQGTDKYPKYLVKFGEVIAFTCFEEANAPERDFTFENLEEKNLCAYQYLDSPWLKSYKPWIEHFNFHNDPVEANHYLIFGGDNNIEIITTNEPTIEIIKEKIIVKLEYDI